MIYTLGGPVYVGGGPEGDVFKLILAKPPSIALISLVFGVDAKETYAKRKSHINYDIHTEDKRGMFSNEDRPAKLLFLTLIAKYLDEIFPYPEVSIQNPVFPDIDRTDRCQDCLMFAFKLYIKTGWTRSHKWQKSGSWSLLF